MIMHMASELLLTEFFFSHITLITLHLSCEGVYAPSGVSLGVRCWLLER